MDIMVQDVDSLLHAIVRIQLGDTNRYIVPGNLIAKLDPSVRRTGAYLLSRHRGDVAIKGTLSQIASDLR